MPFEDTAALLARGLVKLIPSKAGDVLAAQPSYDETVQPLEEEPQPILVESAETVLENAVEAVDEAALAFEAPREYEIGDSVDLTLIDFNDAEFSHDVTAAMIDKFGITLHAVVTEKKVLVARTCLRLTITDMPKAMRKCLRVRPKSFVFLGEQVPVGITVPYTRKGYAALSAREKKQVLQYATRMRDYDVTRGQLAVLRVLKSDDVKMIDKFKKLEARLAWQAGELPSEPHWRALVKE